MIRTRFHTAWLNKRRKRSNKGSLEVSCDTESCRAWKLARRSLASPSLVERQYLLNSGQLVSERSCAKLELKELEKELLLLGGPPTDIAELRLPKDRGAIGARDSANDRRGILIAQRRLIILRHLEFFDAAPHGVGRHSGRAIKDGPLARLKRGIWLYPFQRRTAMRLRDEIDQIRGECQHGWPPAESNKNAGDQRQI